MPKKAIDNKKVNSSRKCLRFDIISAFPEAFSYFNESILYRAQEQGVIEIKFWNLRDFATDKHKSVDDRPYGGGPGMVLKVDVVHRALQAVQKSYRTKRRLIILTDLGGQPFRQAEAKRLSNFNQLIIICGHYEGVDARVAKLVNLRPSIGPYALTGGELPAMVIVDAVSRHLPGFLKNPESLEEKRQGQLVSVPVYTRPETFMLKGKRIKVPSVLLTGHHAAITTWRAKNSKRIK